VKLRVIIFLLASFGLIAIVSGGYFYYHSLQKTALADSHSRAEENIRLIADHIDSVLWEHAQILSSLAGLPEIVGGVDNAPLSLNKTLLYFQETLNMDVFYLLNKQGTCIASSNFDEPTSFIGKNYAFRPYFIEAIQGNRTVYMALGITSHKRGIYLGQPVFSQNSGEIIGVAVLKESIASLITDFKRMTDGKAFLLSPEGIIFAANDTSWLFKSFSPLEEATKEGMKKSRQFGNGPWHWSGFTSLDGNFYQDEAAKRYILHQTKIASYPGWQLVFLHDLGILHKNVLQPVRKTTGITLGLGLVLMAGGIFFLLQNANHEITARKNAELSLTVSKKELEEEHQKLSIAHLQLQDSQVKLLQNEKMASLGRLAAGFSHEINNPLSFVTSNLNSLQKYNEKLKVYLEILEQSLSEEQQEKCSADKKRLKINFIRDDTQQLIAESQQGVSRVAAIVNTFKEFSKVDQADEQSANINEILANCLGMLGEQMLKGITVKRHPGKLPATLCRPRELNQVFLNLLYNACQAMNGHGTLTVTTEERTETILITIHDTGHGIAENDLPRIFDPFFTPH